MCNVVHVLAACTVQSVHVRCQDVGIVDVMVNAAHSIRWCQLPAAATIQESGFRAGLQFQASACLLFECHFNSRVASIHTRLLFESGFYLKAPILKYK